MTASGTPDGFADETIVVTEVCPVRGKGARVRIRMDGAEDFCLYQKEAKRLQLCEGMQLSVNRYQEIMQEIVLPRAKKRALHLLEKQDRSRANLREKLLEGGYPSAIAEMAVLYVESYHYVDDDRYTRNYVSFHKNRKSKRRLAADLRQRGITDAMIEEVIQEEYDQDERDIAKALLAKRHYDPASADRKERERNFRFLLSRGFESILVSELLSC